jgi:Leucine-rich repeat (LRR) protein
MKNIFTIAIFILTTCAFSQTPNHIPTNGLVGFWSFNGNANDESGNELNGTINGATLTADRNGRQNGAYLFSSSVISEITIDTEPLIGTEGLENNFSIMMWVKAGRDINMVSESNDCPGKVTVPMANSNQNWAFRPIHGGDDNLGIGLSIGTNGAMVANHGGNILVNRIGSSFNKTGYSCIVITQNNNNSYLYVDGVLVNSKTNYCTSAIKKLSSLITLGTSLYSPNFSGVIDDFGLWSRALTLSEIKAIYDEKTYVPDDNFEQALIDLGYDDVLDDYVLTNSINSVQEIDISGKDIKDLTGIEDFTSLLKLNTYNNQLTTLDISRNLSLKELSSPQNQLTNIDLSHNTALTNLNLYNNQLTSLDISQNTSLTSLSCASNKLTSLNISQNLALSKLYCSNNQLTSLDVSQHTFLTTLWGNSNQMNCLQVNQTQLENNQDVNMNSPFYFTKDSYAVWSLDCSNVEKTYVPDDNFEQTLIDLGYDNLQDDYVITSAINSVEKLDLIYDTDNDSWTQESNPNPIKDLTGIKDFTSLKILNCYDNQLTSLDMSNNKALTELNCQRNQLTTLNVSQNSLLIYLDCWSNQLTNLNVSQNISLKRLFCFENPYSSLNLRNNIELETLSCGGGLDTKKNLLTSLDITKNTKITNLSCQFQKLQSIDITNNKALASLYLMRNQLTNLNVSSNNNLRILRVDRNELTNLNIKNGNNLNMNVDASDNPNLTCIQVDNAEWSRINWTNIDSQASFSENCSSLGIDFSTMKESIKLYPNPVYDNLTINSSIPVNKVIIYSLVGKQIKQINKNLEFISLRELSNGIYFIKIYTEKGFITKKIIKN